MAGNEKALKCEHCGGVKAAFLCKECGGLKAEAFLPPVLDGIVEVMKADAEKLDARLKLIEVRLQALASAERVAELCGEIMLLKKQNAEFERQHAAHRRHLQNLDGKLSKPRGAIA
jgi:hypothetical protein